MNTEFNFNDFIYLDDKLDVFIDIKHFKNQSNYEPFTHFLLQFIKNTIDYKIEKFKCSTLNIYIDLKDYSLKQIDYTFIKNIIKIFQEEYPNNLKIIYIKNATLTIKTIYAVIKPFIDKETRTKIFFVKKNKKEFN